MKQFFFSERKLIRWLSGYSFLGILICSHTPEHTFLHITGLPHSPRTLWTGTGTTYRRFFDKNSTSSNKTSFSIRRPVINIDLKQFQSLRLIVSKEQYSARFSNFVYDLVPSLKTVFSSILFQLSIELFAHCFMSSPSWATYRWGRP